MAKNFSFKNLKKQYMPVELNDDANTDLMVGMPTKAVMSRLLDFKDDLADDPNSDSAIDELYDICSQIMSRNKAGIEITVEFLSEMYDFADIVGFIQAYSQFVAEISGSKNS